MCADVVFTIVGYPSDVRSVILGESGVLSVRTVEVVGVSFSRLSGLLGSRGWLGCRRAFALVVWWWT